MKRCRVHPAKMVSVRYDLDETVRYVPTVRDYVSADINGDSGGAIVMTERTFPETERVAEIIGYYLASVVSGNNQPDMSGDPRKRIPIARRRHFDDSCRACAEAIIATFGHAQSTTVLEALEFYADPMRYNGPNSRLEGEPDKYQPENLYYRLDVTRDGGRIARRALADTSTDRE